MRRFCNYVLIGYLGLLAIAFTFMQINKTFLSIMIFVLLTMPWSGLLGHYLHQNGDPPEWLGYWFYVTCIFGSGLVNVAILFGISRLFKKSN
jgi:hypothetical protein